MQSDENPVRFRRAPSNLRRREIQNFAEILREEVADGCGFNCLITDDRELRRLNRQFLGKDYATDVLSFPRTDAPALDGEGYSLGDLAISAQRAGEQAREFGHTLEQEIQILMLHGMLHLLGMDHEKDRGRMARAEANWREKLALPGGLIERTRR